MKTPSGRLGAKLHEQSVFLRDSMHTHRLYIILVYTHSVILVI